MGSRLLPYSTKHGINPLFLHLLILLVAHALPLSFAQRSPGPPGAVDPYANMKFSLPLATIIVVLISALFFMGFFPIYTRRCSDSNNSVVRPGVMASSSPPRNSQYDVFLSFRGEDTRDNFTSHLHSALRQNKVETFIDNDLKRGDEISESLVNAIEASSISVIIFSQGYASSRWCLDELVKILDCRHKHGQIVIPVFYRVDPSDVRNQRGAFGDSFSKLEKRFKENSAKLQSWSDALKEAASLSGFHSQNIRPESELVKKVVDHILNRLAEVFPPDSKNQLVGVESRVEEIESLLGADESKDVYTLGIWGIGGIGKTTIARAVFHKISKNFEGSCFLENVREESQRSGELALQQKLLSELFKDENMILDIDLKFRMLKRRKVLIVLDDVTSFKQMKSLIRSPDCFMPESRIIITTRDQQVLKNWGLKGRGIYEMKALKYHYALELFCRHAFKKYHPDEGYEEPSRKVMKYAQGVPLALEILGASLFEREKEIWESAIQKLEIVPQKEIQEVLKISYDGLDDLEQNIFLDIACFFVGEGKDHVISCLDGCGFFSKTGLSVLVDKSLVTINYNKTVGMHDLLRDMGREIVRQESRNDPERRSRLWHERDICKVLTKNTGTEAIKGISLDMNKVNSEIQINTCTFSKMTGLRIFKFYGRENKCTVSSLAGVQLIEVRCFEWHQCPLETLNILHSENLVSLKMPGSKVKQLWDGVQNLGNLKKIDLKDSKLLTKLPDLSSAPNLEILDLGGCSSLMETHSSIQYLNKLEVLDLEKCESLTSLPTSIHSKDFKKLKLSGCLELKNFPEISSCHIHYFDLIQVGIEELPSSIECLSKLQILCIEDCSRLENISSSLFELQSLQYIGISGCLNLKRFQEIPSRNTDGTADFDSMGLLVLRHCESLTSLPTIIFSPEISSFHIYRLELIQVGIEELPSSIECLSILKVINIKDCSRLENIPSSVFKLQSLEHIEISGCSNLKRFQQIPSRNTDGTTDFGSRGVVVLRHCESLTSLPTIIFSPEISSFHITYLDLIQVGIEALPAILSSISFDLCVVLHNCFKLHPNELREIVRDWWKKQSFHDERWISKRMYFPGNEIPKWFRHRSTGSTITLETPEPPPPAGYNKLMGFAFCTVVAFSAPDQHRKCLKAMDCKWKVKSEGSYRHLCSWDVGIIYDAESDHVLLGSYLFGSEDLGNEVNEVNEVSFRIRSLANGCLECSKVEKCGIHFVYAQDLAEPQLRDLFNISITRFYKGLFPQMFR